ncbi:hypothetical protein BACCAP_03216 [Pseudoflavonifractor capillosus ATCC 29799]|uniref:Uncharacterized protein n=1 Tax=Pseudoflavonifractor capillosus ATCC 29799 TaxID=411467 RepID=A6NYB7_9FIRM|nr:hypothetical protein [Pseudoflavonifractor capillosus]EDM99287.1 hypothetical protein BACCAP_03216 [Pseudoflavonifractor capillosus ATCC 29799]
MRDVLFSQFRKRGVEVDLDKIISMVKSVPDYDADKQQPVVGTWRKDRGHPDHYLRKLEEIDESWVRKYLENVLFGIRKNRSGGLREYAAQNQESRVLIGNEGEETEEGELLIDYGEFAPMDIAEAKSKLPYLLKRLHDKSIAMKVSAMSLIIAYERAKLSRKVPKPMDLLAVGVYRMGKDGNIEGRFPPSANSGKVFPPACDWILGYTDAEKRSKMFDLSGFSYDEVITEEDGTEVRVVNTANYQIPITDILGLDRAEFARVWPYTECLEAYDTYVSNLIIVEGEEALTAVRNMLSREQEKIELYDRLPEYFR